MLQFPKIYSHHMPIMMHKNIWLTSKIIVLTIILFTNIYIYNITIAFLHRFYMGFTQVLHPTFLLKNLVFHAPKKQLLSLSTLTVGTMPLNIPATPRTWKLRPRSPSDGSSEYDGQIGENHPNYPLVNWSPPRPEIRPFGNSYMNVKYLY